MAQTSERRWTTKYPKSVPQTIDINQYNNILEISDEAIRKYRNQPAFSNFGCDLSYHELDLYTAQMASYFQNTLGLKKGDRIAIQLPNVLQFPIVLFAAFRAGLSLLTQILCTRRQKCAISLKIPAQKPSLYLRSLPIYLIK